MEINGLIIESVVVGSVGTNCYIVHKKDSEHCFVVDPGDSGDKIANYICDQKMILDHILLTPRMMRRGLSGRWRRRG